MVCFEVLCNSKPGPAHAREVLQAAAVVWEPTHAMLVTVTLRKRDTHNSAHRPSPAHAREVLQAAAAAAGAASSIAIDGERQQLSGFKDKSAVIVSYAAHQRQI
jgi:hypothetical protein